MIELTQLDGTPFTLNDDLIEVVVNIPETKVLLTNGKYYLVAESRREVTNRVIDYERKVHRHAAPPNGRKARGNPDGDCPAEASPSR